MINNYKKGISIAEFLVIVIVLGIIFAVVIPQFSKIRENQVLKSAANNVMSNLNKAQSQTLASVDSSSYGVHLESDKVIIFKGTAFLLGDPNNVTTDIVSPASISNVTFGGISGSEGNIYFNKLTGVPNTTGTITLSTPAYSKIITISATGSVSIN